MAEVPEHYYSGPDEDEDPGPERPALPERPKLGENAKRDTIAEADPELPEEIDQEPQPKTFSETEEEHFKEGAPENADNVQLKPARSSEEDIIIESEIDLTRETEPEISQEVTSGEIGGELFRNLEVPMDEMHEEPDLEPPRAVEGDVPEDLLIESTKETDIELSKETKSEVLRDTLNETRLGLDQTEPEAPEGSFREQYEETGLEPPEQTKLEFPSERSGKSVEESDLQPPEMTKPEIPEETQRKSIKEKGTEPPEQTKPEFPDQKPRKSTEETRRESIEEGIPEPLEEIKSEFLEEKSKKTIEEINLEPLEETKPRSKSSEEEIPQLPEDIKPGDQKEKSRKSSGKPGLVPPQKSKPEEALREKTEEGDIEPPEQTKLEFPKKKPRKSTEETGYMLPQEIKPEAQKKTVTESAVEKGLDLQDEAKPLIRKEMHVESFKEDRPEPIQLKFSVEMDDLEHPKYQTRLSVKEIEVQDSTLGSSTESEMELTMIDYKCSKTLQKLNICKTNSNLHHSEFQRDLRKSFSREKIVDLYQEVEELVPKDKETQPKEIVQFAYLKWSPEEVAEWISQLGFPQYKECFTTNFISGRKLIHVNCSNLPQMGITDFEDMKESV
ncbi:sterile alpha motif domain-containing protein 15 isoform X2 [Tamandua tetradactyla]|uniref:sterile alpha motif domain-containing protein 15 isoform X2 n=1 Tax=Tamandua tetradactyla TaxID=48850 RepID=UPI0040547A40